MVSRQFTMIATASLLICSGGAYWLGKSQSANAARIAENRAAETSATGANTTAGDPESATADFAETFAEIRTMLDRGYWTLNRTWQDRLATLTIDETRTVLDHVIRQRPSDARGAIRRALYARFAELSPEVAFRHASVLAVDDGRNEALDVVFRTWAFNDAPALNAWIAAQSPNDLRSAAIKALLKHMDAVDLNQAIAYAAEAGLLQANVNRTDAEALFDAWANQDPVGAARWIEDSLTGTDRSVARSNLVRSWASVDGPATLRYIEGLPSQGRRVLLPSFWQAAASADPAGAARLAAAMGPGEDQKTAVSSVASTWAWRDPQAALAWARSLPVGGLRDEATRQSISTLSRRDPLAAIDFLEREPELISGSTHGNILMMEMIRAVPERVLTLLQKVPVSAQQRDGLRSALGQIAMTDPERALQLLEDPAYESFRANTTSQALGLLAKDDPERALELLRGLPSASERTQALGGIARSLAADDPELAAVFVTAMAPGHERSSVIGDLAAARAQTDIPGAVQWIATLDDGPDQARAAATLASVWVQRDLAGAVAWSATLDANSSAGRSAIASISTVWAGLDPRGFVQSILAARDDAPRLESLLNSSAANVLSRTSPEQTQLLLEALPPGDQRLALTNSFIAQLASSNPALAEVYIAAMPAGVSRESAINHYLINSHQTRSDAELLTWFGALPPGQTTPANYRQLAARLSSQSSDKSVDWATALPKGDNRDAAISGLVFTGGQTDFPAPVANLILQITDPSVQRSTLDNFATNWFRKAPSAARAWIESSALDAATKQRLLGQAPPGP